MRNSRDLLWCGETKRSSSIEDTVRNPEGRAAVFAGLAPEARRFIRRFGVYEENERDQWYIKGTEDTFGNGTDGVVEHAHRLKGEWWNFVVISGYFGYFLIGPRNHRVENVETKADIYRNPEEWKGKRRTELRSFHFFIICHPHSAGLTWHWNFSLSLSNHTESISSPHHHLVTIHHQTGLH